MIKIRIYANCKEAINEIKRNLYELSVEVWPHSMQNKIVKDDENFSTKELQNESFTILDTTDKDQIVGTCLDWCKAEFEERISEVPKNPGQAYKKRAMVWLQFLNKEGKFCYTYSERIHKQLNKVIEELKVNPDSRQAVIDLHRPSDVERLGGKQRIPCSLEYVIQIRKSTNKDPHGRVNLIYNMRSCDFYTHFKNDIWLACEMKDYVAKKLDLIPGALVMNIASLHMYKKDWEDNVY